MMISFIIRVEKTIAAKRETVFSVAATYPLFMKSYDRKERQVSGDGKLLIQMSMKLPGRTVFWDAEGVLRVPEGIDFEQTNGALKGMRSLWSFAEIDGRTKTQIENHIQFDGSILVALFKRALATVIVKRTLRRILNEMNDAVERGAGSNET